MRTALLLSLISALGCGSESVPVTPVDAARDVSIEVAADVAVEDMATDAPAEPESVVDGPAAPCNAVAEVFAGSCVSGCHEKSGGAAVGFLDFDTTGVEDRVWNAPASGDPNLRLVDPRGAAESAIYRKLLPDPPFGARMPPGPPLSEAKIACVRSWIDRLVEERR
jgi:hypothetical protein